MSQKSFAADHAKRKAELMERQKRERDNLRMRFGRRKTFEQFLVEQGDPQLAEQWRYRDTETPGATILGDGDETPRERDIRDFTAQVRQSPHTLAMRFTIHRALIRVASAYGSWQTHRCLASGRTRPQYWPRFSWPRQKWGTVTITGPDGSSNLRAACSTTWIQDQHPELRREIVRVTARASQFR